MPKINCSLCTEEMLIDEPGGGAYITEGLIITRDAEGMPTSIDETNKTIRHDGCPAIS